LSGGRALAITQGPQKGPKKKPGALPFFLFFLTSSLFLPPLSLCFHKNGNSQNSSCRFCWIFPFSGGGPGPFDDPTNTQKNFGEKKRGACGFSFSGGNNPGPFSSGPIKLVNKKKGGTSLFREPFSGIPGNHKKPPVFFWPQFKKGKKKSKFFFLFSFFPFCRMGGGRFLDL